MSVQEAFSAIVPVPAMFEQPPPKAEYEVDAVLWKPPATLAEAALATFPSPPVTAAYAAEAVFEEPNASAYLPETVSPDPAITSEYPVHELLLPRIRSCEPVCALPEVFSS